MGKSYYLLVWNAEPRTFASHNQPSSKTIKESFSVCSLNKKITDNKLGLVINKHKYHYKFLFCKHKNLFTKINIKTFAQHY